MTDSKPTVSQIAAASQGGYVQYEVITYRGVEILMIKAWLKPAIERTYELTHDPDVETLAREMGITLRRFR